MNKQVNKEIREKIVDNYCNKKWGILKSGREFRIGERVVRRILLEERVSLRTKEEALILQNKGRRIKVNDNYFDIESPNMAYVLGILASDGTVRKKINEIKLTLNEDDSELLEKIKEEIGYEGKIRHYEDKKGFKNATLAFTSKEIKDKLSEYNIIPAKTFNFLFPTKLNRMYWIDFIRGYFDGDGSVGTAGQALRWQVCSATTDVLEKIVEFFNSEYDIPKVNIQTQQRKNPLYVIQYSTNSTKRIFDILYTPNTLYLKRKKDKFSNIVK